MLNPILLLNSVLILMKKDPKFKTGAHVRISNYKNIFAKEYTPNWSEKVFAISKFKIHFHGHMLFMILNDEEIIGSFLSKRTAED